MRDALLPMVVGRPWNTNYRAVFLAMLALACHHAPDPRCPADIVAQADARLAQEGFREHPLRIFALLSVVQRALARGNAADAAARLDELEAVASLPHARLDPQHRWLLEARLWRGDVHAARGDPDRARHEWQAADAGFAERYGPDHPLRRQLALRLAGAHPG